MSHHPPGALRVLIVEDERELGRVLSDYLAEIGHRPEVVGSAEAALDLLGREPPDALVLDAKAARHVGSGVPRSSPVRESPVPVIVVSGYVTEAQAREPLKVLGAVLEYVTAIGRPSGPPDASRERRGASRIAVTLPLRVTTDQGDVAAGAAIAISAGAGREVGGRAYGRVLVPGFDRKPTSLASSPVSPPLTEAAPAASTPSHVLPPNRRRSA